MLASTFFDLVIGLDVHFEMVPMPAPTPTPLPHPFMGMIFDPIGLVANVLISNAIEMGLAGEIKPPKGPVLINFMPATNTGTDCKNKMVLPHFVIPPGTMWTPMPKAPKPKIGAHGTPDPDLPVAPAGDAVLMMGSKTVNIMGSNAVRMGDLAMSCSEPVRMPSSAVLAIPKGPPVLIGGPPAIDWLQAAGALLRSKWVANHLHGLISRIKNARLRAILGKVACFLTGHPVDVASGRLLTWMSDWELPGPIPLTFERNYASGWANRDSVLGWGWSHSFDEAVWLERGRVVYRADDGREIEFDTFELPGHFMRKGDEVFEPINRLTLRNRGAFSWEIEDARGLIREFEQLPGEARGVLSRLVRIRNHAGHEVRLEYDAASRLEWLRDSGGRLVRFEYDRNGRLWRVALPHPTQDGWLVHTEYKYDAGGDLVAVVDPLGHTTHYGYAGNHLMVRETDRAGLSFFFGYDGVGADARCIRTWGDGGIYDHEIAYDVANHVTVVTNSMGETTVYQADALGLVRKVVDPLGNATLYEYDEALRRIKTTLPDGSERKTAYDARGNRVETVAADGASVKMVYAGDELPVSATMPSGGVWSWRHDHKQRLIERRDPLGHTTRFRYDPRTNMPAAIEDAGGGRTVLRYDGAGNLTEVVAPDGGTRRFEHDRLGRVIRSTDERGHVERREYDPLGRVLRVERAQEPPRLMQYDAEGHLVQANIGRRVIRLGYSGRYHVASRSEAGTVVRFNYDTEDRIRAVTNEAGEIWSVQRDGAGRVVAEKDFDGAVTRYKLDSCGRIVAITQPSGAVTEVVNDPMGRPTEVTLADGSKNTYAYSPEGKLIEAVNAHATVQLQRDLVGRVVREQQGDSWVASAYDPLHRRVGLASSFGLDERIERDARGWVRAVAVAPAPGAPIWSTEFARDLGGLEERRRFPGGEVLTQRDEVGRPLTQRILVGGQERTARTFRWDEDGKLGLLVDAALGPTTFHRDERGRLTEAVHGRDVEVMARDEVGNVYRSPGRDDRRHGAGGRLLQADGVRYEHDADGQLTAAYADGQSGWRYHFDAAGMLDAVHRPDGREVRFAYDALGRRVSKSSDAGTSRYLWDGDDAIHELSSARGLETWTFEPDTMYPLGHFAGGQRLGVVRDYQGTPHTLLGDDGTVTPVPITASGALATTAISPDEFAFRFEGQTADAETGLLYNRFRYYDPVLGRYISKDPLGVLGGLNLYAYVGDPTAGTDPFGLLEEWETAPYGSSRHAKDGLEAHELLQSAWLKENVPEYTGRNSGIGRQNPAMALDPAVHSAISAAQRNSGVNLATETARQNIARNAAMLEAEMIASGMAREEAQDLVRRFRREAEEYAESIHCA